MPKGIRAERLQCLLAQLKSAGTSSPLDVAPTSQVHDWSQPTYAIPLALLDALERRVNGILMAEEMNLEREFAERCEKLHAVGHAEGRFVSHPIFHQTPLQSVRPEEFATLGWDERYRAATLRLPVLAKSLTEPLLQQQKGFLGWLTTNATFVKERMELRAELGSKVSFRGAVLVLPPE